MTIIKVTFEEELTKNEMDSIINLFEKDKDVKRVVPPPVDRGIGEVIGLITITLKLVKVTVDGIVEDIKCFVTLDRFQPIEKIVWTLVGLILTSVVGAALTLILK